MIGLILLVLLLEELGHTAITGVLYLQTHLHILKQALDLSEGVQTLLRNKRRQGRIVDLLRLLNKVLERRRTSSNPEATCFICTCISPTSDFEMCRSGLTGLHCELKVFNSGNEILFLGLQLVWVTPQRRKKSLSLIQSWLTRSSL